jgi:hypothetical protein
VFITLEKVSAGLWNHVGQVFVFFVLTVIMKFDLST